MKNLENKSCELLIGNELSKIKGGDISSPVGSREDISFPIGSKKNLDIVLISHPLGSWGR